MLPWLPPEAWPPPRCAQTGTTETVRKNAAKVSRRRMEILYATFPDANLRNPRGSAPLTAAPATRWLSRGHPARTPVNEEHKADREVRYLFLPFLGTAFLAAALLGGVFFFSTGLAAFLAGLAGGFCHRGAFAVLDLANGRGAVATAVG